MTVRPDLLTTLDILVKQDGAQPFFSGNIAIGVLPAEGPTRWWLAEFGKEAKTSFPEAIPATNSDALVALSPEAAWFLLSGEHPADHEPVMMVLGDKKLVERFVHRYLNQTKGVGHQMMRVQGARHTQEAKS